jgi:ubiquinone/menaquinone biosynthesis C-methylase UbiE
MRIFWPSSSHERLVEKFYGRGVEHYGNYHNGYLNFGLWENGISEYVAAAENLVRRMGTLLGLTPSSRLLDVACGMGTQDIYLAETFSPELICGVDVTWKHIEHGQRRARESRLEDRVRFSHGTAVKLPFERNSFTHVMSIEGPEHFNTRETFMKEAFRVLKTGGVMALADYSLKRGPKNIFEKVIVEAARRLWKVPEANVDSKETYEEKLRRSGFKNISIEEVGALTIPGYYFEQKRPATRRAISKIRGFVGGRLGFIIDVAVYKAFQRGLLEYILVRAEK